MLSGKRSGRLGEQLLKEIADILLRKVKDPRIKKITLTGIQLSQDLKNAKVYFSLIGDAEEIKQAQHGLESAKGFIKHEIASRLNLKHMPDIIFKHDISLVQADLMEKLFSKIHRESSPSDLQDRKQTDDKPL